MADQTGDQVHGQGRSTEKGRKDAVLLEWLLVGQNPDDLTSVESPRHLPQSSGIGRVHLRSQPFATLTQVGIELRNPRRPIEADQTESSGQAVGKKLPVADVGTEGKHAPALGETRGDQVATLGALLQLGQPVDRPVEGRPGLGDREGRRDQTLPHQLRLSLLGELRKTPPHVAAGVISCGEAAIVGVGRMAFAYPDFARDLLEKGVLDPKRCCVACSGCTELMRGGGPTGCIMQDREFYRLPKSTNG